MYNVEKKLQVVLVTFKVLPHNYQVPKIICKIEIILYFHSIQILLNAVFFRFQAERNFQKNNKRNDVESKIAKFEKAIGKQKCFVIRFLKLGYSS